MTTLCIRRCSTMRLLARNRCVIIVTIPDEFLIPMAFDEIDVLNVLPDHVYSLRNRGRTRTMDDRRVFNVEVCDGGGAVLVAVRNFSMKVGSRNTLDAQTVDSARDPNYLEFENAISANQGEAVLQRLLVSSLYPQVVVSPVDFRRVFAESRVVSDTGCQQSRDRHG